MTTRRAFLQASAAVTGLGHPWLRALSQHPAPMPIHAPLLGSAWYPEQWPEKTWAQDLDLMQAAGFNVVRVGEFAWSSLEPAEGRYELDWLARAIEAAAQRHIAVVIGTPTDAPPAWLTSKYPQVLRIDEQGMRAEHGTRRQFNYVSPLYRQFCAAIVTQLARRFAAVPNVIGWQIGNEYTDESFDPQTKRVFQEFLQKKYGSLAELNRRWTTAYWSQTYDSWDEIPMKPTGENPGLLLEHKHFVTQNWRVFQRAQIQVLDRFRRPDQFVTTNIGGLAWSDNWDHYRICEDLTLASWDDYVGSGHLDVARHAFISDFVRGWRRQNYWVMETQPGSVNWSPLNNVLRRGETRAMAWQSVAHGADAILYWQWRSALNGQEQYHGCIVGPDGEPLPLYAELMQMGEEFQRLSALIDGSSVNAEAALLVSYDSRWAIDFQPHTNLYDQQQILVDWHRSLHAAAGEVDVVEASAPLQTYKLVLAPSLNVIGATLAKHLEDYVRGGGHLVLGPRSGMKDDDDALQVDRQPGPLSGLLGGRVEQYYALPQSVPVAGAAGSGSASVWAEALSARDADTEVLLRYGKTEGGWLDRQPAMISRKVGTGRITYLGTLPEQALLDEVVARFAAAALVAPPSLSVPEGIDVGCRVQHSGRKLWIVVNGTNAAQQMHLPAKWQEHLSGKAVAALQLEPYGIAVLTEAEG